MIKEIDPGRKRKTLVLNDDITYSQVKDLQGRKLSLQMSIMAQAEVPRPIIEPKEWKKADTEFKHYRRPAIIWIPGDGWRGGDNKNKMVPEEQFLAEEGYVVASIYYRSSAEGKWPAQIIDIKTAVRFLRENAAKYDIDPSKIGVMGRSAGGHLAVFAALNQEEKYLSDEYANQSSKVEACIDMFGPVDLSFGIKQYPKLFKDPNYRWHKLSETHEGALMGLPDDIPMKEAIERCKVGSPINYINPNMAPLIILHGEGDPLVPIRVSEDLYQKACETGLEDQTEFIKIKHAGHGTPELFQPETKEEIVNFLRKYLN